MNGQRDHFSAYSHFVGALGSLVFMIILIVSAAVHATSWHVISFSIYGVSLILLYTASATYHFIRTDSPARQILRQLDHIFIFILIAGTYTPLCLTVLRGGWGWTLFGIIWTGSFIGVLLRLYGRVPQWVNVMLYLVMGWLAAIALVPLSQTLSMTGLAWLFGGGVSYSIGAGCYALDVVYPSQRWFNLHDLFHVLVLIGSVCHGILMFQYVL